MSHRKVSRGFHPSSNHFHRDRSSFGGHHMHRDRPHFDRHGHSHSCSHDTSSSLGSIIGLGVAAFAIGSALKKSKNEIPSLSQSTQNTREPTPKNIGGATKIYLPMILRDFPDFHSPNAESDIKAVMRDYIYCVHTGQNTLDSHAVNENVLSRIIPKQNGTVTDISFHQLEIQNYQKSVNYATIYYRTSFGYRLNGVLIETKYEIQYTLQLRDLSTSVSTLRCKNCNAPIDSLDAVSTCKYCDAKIVRDTIMNWVVSDIHELR